MKHQALSDAIVQFESGREVKAGFRMWKCQTGERYVSVCSGGQKQEGEPLPALCATPELAIKLWVDAVNEYAAGKGGAVYWRMRPELTAEEIERDGFEPDRRYYVYSRLVITDKPEILKQVGNEFVPIMGAVAA